MTRAGAPEGCGTWLFDFDGTLADLLLDWGVARRALAGVLEAELAANPGAARREFSGGVQRLAEQAVEAFGPRGRALAARVLAEQEERAALVPLPEGIALLRRALEEGPVAIVSNNTRRTLRRGVRDLGLDEAGLVLVGFEDVDRSKPDPQGVLLALSRLGRGPEGAVLVGDADTDRQAAEAAGVAFRRMVRPDTETQAE